ncbi:MAG: FkbM family methyltransferase, partial [Cyanobacteria bacterium HKST-UBA01]|nr:FkbM family methyltransferase [Cyanobacteria bacterium HKST-UBA01]
MNFGDRLLQAAQKRRENKRRKLKGPLGDYYRSGGNILLYDLPITSEGIVIDAGGFNGDWTRNIILMYGCRSEIFEPFPEYAVKLENFFRRNPHVNVHKVGLGGAGRLTNMAFQDDATSEFIPGTNMKGQDTQVEIVDVADYLAKLQDAEIDCIKLNIEGAEYEVLERILEDKQIV